MKTTLSLILIAGLANGIYAQAAQVKPVKQFSLPAGEIQVQDLIDRCAGHLDVNILTSPPDCADSPAIHLHKSIETDTLGCEELLTSLLYRSGFVLTVVDPKHDLLEVIKINGPRCHEIRMRTQDRSVESILARPNLVIPVTTVIKLKHINAQRAMNSLRPFYASGVTGRYGLEIGSTGSTSTLILQGMQYQVAHAIRMLQRSDVADAKNNPDVDIRLTEVERRIKSVERKVR